MKEALRILKEGLVAFRPKVSCESLIRYICLTLICIIAFLVRILPLQWGAYLSEFDPYYHYRVAEYISKNGFHSFLTWHDYNSWFPWGRDIASTTPPGLPFAAAFLYLVSSALGLPFTLMDICIFFPVLMGAITCLAIYFLAKDIGGEEVGLLSAFFLALLPAYIERTYLGFFKHESIGIFLIVASSLCFLRSIDPKRSLRGVMAYSVMTGLFLGYLNISWGAAPYQTGLITLFVLALLLLRRYNSHILYSYSMTLALSLLIGIQFPRPGKGILSSMTTLPSYVTLFVLILFESFSKLKTLKGKARMTLILCLILLGGSLFVLLNYMGFFAPIAGKFEYVLNPLARGAAPIVESVAEHHPASWDSFYLRFGPLLLFAIAGVIFAAQRLSDGEIYSILFGLTSLYFASSYIRLILIMAPAFALLSALAVVRLIKPFLVRGMASSPKGSRAGSNFGLVVCCLTFLLILPPPIFEIPGLTYGISIASFPVTIASSTIPIRGYVGDWLEACAWIRDNAPENAVIVSWWDYGYYITVIGNRTSLADNSTINATAIRDIALAFMSEEEKAIEILKRFKATHVLVFTTLSAGIHYGDEAKWTWMAQIASTMVPESCPFGHSPSFKLREDVWCPQHMVNIVNVAGGVIDEGLSRKYRIYLPNGNFLLTKLMLYGAFRENPPSNFRLVFESSYSVRAFGIPHGLVFIYEIAS